MFPGTVLQAAASAPTAPNAAASQLPPGAAGRFDKELDAAFDAASAAADPDGDAAGLEIVEQSTPVDPRSAREWWRTLGGAAASAPPNSDETACANQSTPVPSDDEDAIEDEAAGADSQESAIAGAFLQVVPDISSANVPGATPTGTAATSEASDGAEPVRAQVSPQHAPTAAPGVPGVDAPLTAETAGVDGEELTAAPQPTQNGEVRTEVGDAREAPVDHTVEDSRVSDSRESAASRAERGRSVAVPEIPRSAVAGAGEARRPQTSHTAMAASADADAVAKSVVSTPALPEAQANGNGLAAHLSAMWRTRSAVSADGRTVSDEGEPAASSDAGANAKAGAEVSAIERATSQAASSDGGGSGGGGWQEAAYRAATGDVVAGKSSGPAQAPTMVLVQGPDGTLRLTSAPSTELALLTPTPQERAENIERLVQTMRVLVKDGVSEATLRLHPEHLGEVSIAIRVDGKMVSAVINAESAGVREWIQAQENMLRSGLSEQGLYLDRLLVQRDSRHDPREQPQPEPRRPRAKRDGATRERFEVSA